MVLFQGGGGPLFTDVCVWDFIAQLQKIRIVGGDDVTSNPSAENSASFITELLSDVGRTRPCDRFLPLHDEHTRRQLKVLHPTQRRVVVPIGPRIVVPEHADRDAKYSRLMLILTRRWSSR